MSDHKKADFMEGMRDNKVLHVGCGTGGLTVDLANMKIGSVVGIDARQECVEAA